MIACLNVDRCGGVIYLDMSAVEEQAVESRGMYISITYSLDSAEIICPKRRTNGL